MTLSVLTATISAGQSVSTAVDCSAYTRIVRMVMPPDWTAAPITFCMSADNTIYHDLYHTGAPGDLTTHEVVIPNVVANAVVAFPTDTGGSVAWFKIRSGMHAAPVIQTADRVFQIVVDLADTSSGAGSPGPVGPTGPAGAIGPVGPQGLPGGPAAPSLLQTVVLGHAIGINYNVIGDTVIAISAAKYAITQLVTFNNVGGKDNYTGSLRDAAAGAGNDLGGYAYNTDGQLGDWSDYPGPLPVINNPTLYFHVGTKEGAPAVGDLYLMGYDLTGL